MKSLLTAIFAGALLATSPAWADGGHGHGHGHGKHAEKEWKKQEKHWAKHHRKMHRHDHFEEHVVVHQHFHPAPRVVHRQVIVASPPPGVHVVMPSIHVPF